MSGQRIIEGAQQAALWVKATKGGTELPTEADRLFLRRLADSDIHSPYDQGAPLLVRARCSRLGWADQHGKSSWGWDWFITPAGRVVLDTRVHGAAVPQHAPVADEDSDTPAINETIRAAQAHGLAD